MPRSRGLVASLRRAMFGVGPLATAQALLRQLRRTEPEPQEGPQPSTGTHPFDTSFGVDTGGFLSWRELQTGGANDPYVSGYLGVAPSVARRLIGLVQDPARYAFVDLGCGKGRATIIASEFPFRRVIGVEIAPNLAATARANAATIRAHHPDRPPIEIVLGDAATFDLPPNPLVLFLYQPFELPVMRRVLARLAVSLAAAPRATVILYVHPALARLLDRNPLLERRTEGAYELEPRERPFAYNGRGHSDNIAVWGTRAPKPALR